MFTGIVEEAARVEFLNEGRLRIRAERVLEDLAQGDSVAVNGACLTAVSVNSKGFEVDLVPETLRRTNLGDLKQGSTVNLERSLAANARLGGHIVQGHVDGTGTVAEITPEGDARVVRISAPPEVIRYLVEKAFIAVNGISLTVMALDEDSFSVSLVRHTYEHTDLGDAYVGMPVNLETDILAKYTERLLHGEREGMSALIEEATG